MHRFLFAEATTPIDCFSKVKTIYGESVMNGMNVFQCSEFNEGRTNVDDLMCERYFILIDN